MRQIACGLLAAGLIATAGTAQAQQITGSASFLTQARSVAADLARSSTVAAAQAAPAPRPVKITGAFDFPTLYFFRGIRQEFDADLTFQPWVNVAYTASPTVTLNVGSWNSIHSGSNSDEDVYDGAFYETDFYASGAFATGKVTSTLLYTAYMSPIDAFGPVHEIAYTAGFSDSESSLPMAPAVTLAFELSDKSADGGDKKGIYLELAATPGIPVGDDAPVTLTVPIKFGFSLKDYYENPSTGEDSGFGYLSIGLMGLVPISPNLDIHGGVLIYAFGDTLKLFNDDESSKVVGTIGLGFSF